MLHDQLRELRRRVAEASHRLGRNAGLIVDEVLDDAFPKTCEASRIEGADSLLRSGAVAWVRGVLGQGGGDDEVQYDFVQLCEDFQEEVKPLGKHSYFVPSVGEHGEHVPVGRLIAEPELLNEARKFTRQKGEETIAEADRLDALYEAVIARKAS